MKKVLLIGSGAREHAIAQALVSSQRVELYSAMGSKNPGIARLSEQVLLTETDYPAIAAFAVTGGVDYCFVGPEEHLGNGVTDILEASGIRCSSPSQAAARIETDKSFMRELLGRQNIDGQIQYAEVSSRDEAVQFCEQLGWKVAVKPIGLTAGKGVKVWGDQLRTPQDVIDYMDALLERGFRGERRIILEELLEGEEFTVQFFCDGTRAFASPAVKDHKRAFDGDLGPNTGGMGSYSFGLQGLPFASPTDYETACSIGSSVITAMKAEGVPFKGILYGQFMVTPKGVKIVEFNSRFGDPEAMNILPLLTSDFSLICEAIICGQLSSDLVCFQDATTVVRYVVPAGYGESPRAGEIVHVDEHAIASCGARLFFGSCLPADDVMEQGETLSLLTTSSRTLAVMAIGDSLEEARRVTGNALRHVSGNVFYRKDIAGQGSIDESCRKARLDRNQQIPV